MNKNREMTIRCRILFNSPQKKTTCTFPLTFIFGFVLYIASTLLLGSHASHLVGPEEMAHLAARRNKRQGGHRHSPYTAPLATPGIRSVVPGSSKGNMTVVISEGSVYVAAIANLHWNVRVCLGALL